MDRPILFSGSMVRALLAGTKTQTRRIVKPQPAGDLAWGGWVTCSTNRKREGMALWGQWSHPDQAYLEREHAVLCPYGQPGDRLWVRENYRFGAGYNGVRPSDVMKTQHALIQYEADDHLRTVAGVVCGEGQCFTPGDLRPSIHMPRAASRISLDITGVRVERLQAISETDAKAEGITQEQAESCDGYDYEDGSRAAYAALWDRINGEDEWAANPWVWCLNFRRILP